MGNGLKVASFVLLNGSKVTPLLYKSNLLTTAYELLEPSANVPSNNAGDVTAPETEPNFRQIIQGGKLRDQSIS
jgi:hypothetical protein